MTPDETDDFADRYFHAWRVLSSGARAERVAFEQDPDRATDALSELLLTAEGAETAWPLILVLIERAPDDEAVAFVAAGPLEDIVRHHGPQFAARLIEGAQRDARVRQALAGAWVWEDVREPLRSSLLGLIGSIQGNGYPLSEGLEVIATGLGALDPICWSTRRLGIVLAAWIALGAAAALAWHLTWIFPLWLLVFGFLFWRAAGFDLRATLSWLVPLIVLMSLAMLVPGLAGRVGMAILALVALGFLCLQPVQVWWLRVIGRSRPNDLGELPEHAVRLRAALTPVDEALRDSFKDRDADRIHAAVSHARVEIAAIPFPPDDPWAEPGRLAVVWLRDLDALAQHPHRGPAAYAVANRRARELEQAQKKAAGMSGRL